MAPLLKSADSLHDLVSVTRAVIQKFFITCGVCCWNLTLDRLSIWCRDSELTFCAHLNLLVLGSVENLEDILAQVVAGACFQGTALQQHLNVS